MAPGLQFGVETELFLSAHEPARNQGPSAGAFATDFVSYYNSAVTSGISKMRWVLHDGPHPGHNPQSRGEWSITEDDTVRVRDEYDENKITSLGWPFELVSPILKFEPGSKWRRALQEHWLTIRDFAKPHINDSCSTHVHVSPKAEVEWQLSEVKRVAQSVLYFEDAWEAVLPPSRCSNVWAKSNRVDNIELKHLNLRQCFSRIQDCDKMDDLIYLMNPDNDRRPDDVPPNKLPPKDRRRISRLYGWNFQNLEEDGLGTIECRRPPGVLNGEACCVWIEMVASFVYSAMKHGDLEDLNENNYTRDVKGLERFCYKGLVSDMQNPIALDSVFHKRSGASSPVPVAAMSKEMRELLRRKDDEEKRKNIIMEKIRDSGGL